MTKKSNKLIERELINGASPKKTVIMQKRMHVIWATIRKGWGDYISIVISLTTFLTIFEGLILLIFPSFRTYTAAGFVPICLLILLYICYLFGKIGTRMDKKIAEDEEQ